MTDAASLDNPPSEPALDEEWAELGGGWFGTPKPGDDRPALWFFPVLLLYTGFFFGPFVTALFAVFTMRGRVGMRRGAILVGTCGATWCLLQGVSLYNGAWWSELELQSMRSTANFVAGIICYIIVRPPAMRHYRQSMRTLVVTLSVITLATLVFIALPSSLLVAMGR